MALFLTDDEYEDEKRYWQNKFVKNCTQCNSTITIVKDNKNYKCQCAINATIYAALVANGLPKYYLTWDWDNCKNVDVNVLLKIQDYVNNFHTNFEKCKGLYIFGTQGVGKTTLTTVMAKHIALQINPLMNRNYRVAFASLDKLIFWFNNQNHFSSDYKKKLDSFIRNAELAIIDNIGAEEKHRADLLDIIVRDRRNKGYPTIITSNFDLQNIHKIYSDTVQNFIKENSKEIFVYSNNTRKQGVK